MGYCQLTHAERYAIATSLSMGHGVRQIALAIGRDPSTVSRELRRNATRHDGHYRAEKAQSYAVARRRRCRRKSQYSLEQWARIERLLGCKWSPQQISNRLKMLRTLWISHETIYRYVRRDKLRGGRLWRHMRGMAKFGRKRYGRRDSRGVLPGKRHISQRPKEVQGRRCLGHWEGDTVMGADQRHCVLTLVERKSGFVIIKKLQARTKEQACTAVQRALIGHHEKFKTITFDNGTEFHDYKLIEQRFRVKCYFATPYHSWERGCNENTNGLIRQYLPKGTSMSNVTQADCDAIARELNDRPRKRLGYKTPAELYHRS